MDDEKTKDKLKVSHIPISHWQAIGETPITKMVREQIKRAASAEEELSRLKQKNMLLEMTVNFLQGPCIPSLVELELMQIKSSKIYKFIMFFIKIGDKIENSLRKDKLWE